MEQPEASNLKLVISGSARSASPRTVEPDTKSPDMTNLLAYQSKLQELAQRVNQRIFQLEEQYLEETTMGNVIRGWDQDAKPMQKKSSVEDKDRLFSNSSIINAIPPGRGGFTGVFQPIPPRPESKKRKLSGR